VYFARVVRRGALALIVATFALHSSSMKIYTKTGDDGTTGLFGGARVKKASPRVEAYGEVDELNAALGVARATQLDEPSEEILALVQADLFTLGAEMACVPGKEAKLGMALLGPSNIHRLEQAIDSAEAELTPLKTFVLPAGCREAAALHYARTVCRRAERAVLRVDDAPARPDLVIYLNRLSDLLFVLARRANAHARVPDVPWEPRKS
jgi:cob(I)alamin adenosyltransferase